MTIGNRRDNKSPPDERGIQNRQNVPTRKRYVFTPPEQIPSSSWRPKVEHNERTKRWKSEKQMGRNAMNSIGCINTGTETNLKLSNSGSS